jgi:hypothetical protein
MTSHKFWKSDSFDETLESLTCILLILNFNHAARPRRINKQTFSKFEPMTEITFIWKFKELLGYYCIIYEWKFIMDIERERWD